MKGNKLTQMKVSPTLSMSFFTNIGPQLDKTIPKSQRPGGSLFYLNSRIPHSFLLSPTTTKEISNIINTLDDS